MKTPRLSAPQAIELVIKTCELTAGKFADAIGMSPQAVMWYELVRPHKILEDAVAAVWSEIEQKTELTIFNGKP